MAVRGPRGGAGAGTGVLEPGAGGAAGGASGAGADAPPGMGNGFGTAPVDAQAADPAARASAQITSHEERWASRITGIGIGPDRYRTIYGAKRSCTSELRGQAA